MGQRKPGLPWEGDSSETGSISGVQQNPNFPKNQKWALSDNSFGDTPIVIERQIYVRVKDSTEKHMNPNKHLSRQSNFCEMLKQVKNNRHLQIIVCTRFLSALKTSIASHLWTCQASVKIVLEQKGSGWKVIEK